MKKLLITLALGFIVSMQSFASHSILNEDKINLKSDCIDIELESYTGECPDGSTYYAGSFIIITECGNPQSVVGWGFDYGDSYEDACGD